jgi:hypothetical protein
LKVGSTVSPGAAEITTAQANVKVIAVKKALKEIF